MTLLQKVGIEVLLLVLALVAVQSWGKGCMSRLWTRRVVKLLVKKVLEQGYRTADIYQKLAGEKLVTTKEMGAAIIANL